MSGNGKGQTGRVFASGLDLDIWLDTSTGSSASTLGDWEVDERSFAAGVIGMLAAGLPVWLGTTRDGLTVTITTEIGGEKQRSFVRDAIEWDDYWVARAKQADIATARRRQRAVAASAAPPAPQGENGSGGGVDGVLGTTRRQRRAKREGLDSGV